MNTIKNIDSSKQGKIQLKWRPKVGLLIRDGNTFDEGDARYKELVLFNLQKLVPNIYLDSYQFYLGKSQIQSNLAEGLLYSLIRLVDEKECRGIVIIGYDKDFVSQNPIYPKGGNQIKLVRNNELLCKEVRVNYNVKTDNIENIQNGLGKGKNWKHDTCFSLIHELIHAFHVMYSKFVPDEDGRDIELIKREEIKTCVETNCILREAKLKNLAEERKAYNYGSELWIFDDIMAKDDKLKKEIQEEIDLWLKILKEKY